jgi:hypothetical protein
MRLRLKLQDAFAVGLEVARGVHAKAGSFVGEQGDWEVEGGEGIWYSIIT